MPTGASRAQATLIVLARSGLRRFSIQEATTPDLFSSYAQERALRYLLYEVHLFFGEEHAYVEDDELVKIAEVLRAEGQGAVLSKRYIPPCLTVSASYVADGISLLQTNNIYRTLP